MFPNKANTITTARATVEAVTMEEVNVTAVVLLAVTSAIAMKNNVAFKMLPRFIHCMLDTLVFAEDQILPVSRSPVRPTVWSVALFASLRIGAVFNSVSQLLKKFICCRSDGTS